MPNCKCVYCYFYPCMYIQFIRSNILVGPPRKKQRTDKRGKMEKALDYAMTSFAKHEREAEEQHMKREEDRWAKQMEIEERRRREDKEHEERMMRMMERMFHRPSPYNYNTDEYPYDNNY